MKSRSLLVALTMLAAVSAPLHAANESPSRSKSAWARFLSSEGAGWDVRFNRSETSPEIIRPPRAATIPAWHQDHAEAVKAFFARNAELFGLDPQVDELRSVGERTHKAISHVRMQQFHRGLPVLGGEYMVSVGPAGDPRLIAGGVRPQIDVAVTPTTTEAEAIAIAVSDRGQPADQYDIRVRLAIDPEVTGGRLVYEVTLRGNRIPDAWQILVSARGAGVLSRFDLALRAPACGMVYREGNLHYPVIESRGFQINEPSEVATLKGPLVEVSELATTNVVTDVYQLDPPGGCWDFHYDPVQHHQWFNQVNTYFHVDRFFGEYLPSHGYSGTEDPVQVRIYSPGCARSSAGPGVINLCGNDARLTDIILHEAGHVVVLSFGVSSNGPAEAKSLHEGFATYFACAASNDSVVGESPGMPGTGFNIHSDRGLFNYPNIGVVPLGFADYDGSFVWAGTIWDMRLSSGAIIDDIVLESLFYLPSTGMTFSIGAWALVQADLDHHQGAHVGSIRAACQGRGFDIEPLQAKITGPALVDLQETVAYSAAFPWGRAPYTYHWTADAWLANGLIESDIDLGTASQANLSTGDALAFKLRLDVTDALGATDHTYQWIHVCQAQGPGGPFMVDIAGGPVGSGSGDFAFFPVLQGGGCRDSLSYRWEISSVPQPGYQVVGTGATLAVNVSSNFDLRLIVRGLPGSDMVGEDEMRVSNPDIPVVSISGPSTLSICDVGVPYQAVVGAGDAPRDYVWTLSHPTTHVIGGNASSVPVDGTGATMTLCVSVTTGTDLEADPACVTIGATTGCDSPLLAPVSVGRRDEAVELVVNVQGDTDLSLKVFDIAGREVGRVFDGRLASGRRTFTWSTAGRQPGVYFIRAAIGDQIAVKRVLVMR